MRFALPLLLASTLAAPVYADAHVGERVTGTVLDRGGDNIGSISVFETESGIVRVTVQAVGITPGTHGVHLHEVGECEGDFTSAGGHIPGDANHGLVAGGNHPGDLPNAYVGDDGELSMEAFKTNLSVADHLLDADGAALIIHDGPDDYTSQPSGAAGSRVACAVLTETN